MSPLLIAALLRQSDHVPAKANSRGCGRLKLEWMLTGYSPVSRLRRGSSARENLAVLRIGEMIPDDRTELVRVARPSEPHGTRRRGERRRPCTSGAYRVRESARGRVLRVSWAFSCPLVTEKIDDSDLGRTPPLGVARAYGWEGANRERREQVRSNRLVPRESSHLSDRQACEASTKQSLVGPSFRGFDRRPSICLFLRGQQSRKPGSLPHPI